MIDSDTNSIPSYEATEHDPPPPKRQKLDTTLDLKPSDNGSLLGSEAECRRLRIKNEMLRARLVQSEATARQFYNIRKEVDEIYEQEKSLLQMQVKTNEEEIEQLQRALETTMRALVMAESSNADLLEENTGLKSMAANSQNSMTNSQENESEVLRNKLTIADNRVIELEQTLEQHLLFQIECHRLELELDQAKMTIKKMKDKHAKQVCISNSESDHELSYENNNLEPSRSVQLEISERDRYEEPRSSLEDPHSDETEEVISMSENQLIRLEEQGEMSSRFSDDRSSARGSSATLDVSSLGPSEVLMEEDHRTSDITEPRCRPTSTKNVKDEVTDELITIACLNETDETVMVVQKFEELAATLYDQQTSDGDMSSPSKRKRTISIDEDESSMSSNGQEDLSQTNIEEPDLQNVVQKPAIPDIQILCAETSLKEPKSSKLAVGSEQCADQMSEPASGEEDISSSEIVEEVIPDKQINRKTQEDAEKAKKLLLLLSTCEELTSGPSQGTLNAAGSKILGSDKELHGMLNDESSEPSVNESSCKVGQLYRSRKPKPIVPKQRSKNVHCDLDAEKSNEPKENLSSEESDEPTHLLSHSEATQTSEGTVQVENLKLVYGKQFILVSSPKFFDIDWSSEYKLLGPFRWECQSCSKIEHRKYVMEDHIWVEHHRGVFKCPHCSFDDEENQFSTRNVMTRHCKTAHPNLVKK